MPRSSSERSPINISSKLATFIGSAIALAGALVIFEPINYLITRLYNVNTQGKFIEVNPYLDNLRTNYNLTFGDGR